MLTRDMDAESWYFNFKVIPNVDAAVLAGNVAADLEFEGINFSKLVAVYNTSTNTGCDAGLVKILK